MSLWSIRVIKVGKGRGTSTGAQYRASYFAVVRELNKEFSKLQPPENCYVLIITLSCFSQYYADGALETIVEITSVV